MHKRTQLRNQIHEALIKSKINAINQRYYPLQMQSAPYALIYTHSSETEYISNGFPRTRKHNTNLVIEIVVSGGELDDKLDSMSAQIEKVLTPKLGINISLIGSKTETSTTGERPVAVMLQQWQITHTDNELEP